MKDSFRNLNDHLKKHHIMDFVVTSFSHESDRLEINGYADFCYPGEGDVKIAFEGVQFMSLPTYFGNATFREGRSDEITSIKNKYKYRIDFNNATVIFIDEEIVEEVCTHFVISEKVNCDIK